MELNFIDKFLYKLAILTFILLGIIGLHKLGIINYHDIQKALSNNINFLQVVETVNGESNLLTLDFEEVVSANTSLIRSEKIENGKRVILDSYEAVESLELGIVVNIKNDKVYILDKDDNTFCYSGLESIDVNIYQIVRKNQIIGKAAVSNEGINYYNLYVTKNNNYIDWLI